MLLGKLTSVTALRFVSLEKPNLSLSNFPIAVRMLMMRTARKISLVNSER
jgi:hypothetical protein